MDFRNLFKGIVCLTLAAAVPPWAGAQVDSPQPPTQAGFQPAAPQGFDDRYNSQTWSLQWFQNSLFLGTGRATACVQAATLVLFRPDLGTYPPEEEDVECTPDPHDLPLQAQIWRFTPGFGGGWEMVYESPNDVPIEGTTKFTARDIGYRGMAVIPEPGPGGTEIDTLYVSGVTSRAAEGVGFAGPVPPPRILRSRDGVTFEPIPQDPGTFLGDITVTGFRGMEMYNGKLYVIASVGLLGHGLLLESERPWEGNDSFRVVSPEGMTFFEIETYNGYLYAGTGVQPTIDDTPFSLLKTDATGPLPYDFEVVIPDGAHKGVGASAAVISMREYGDRLYVGTDRELLRVNPDDSWQLTVGGPRPTPLGPIAPLSGMNVGFDNLLNIHMWRMTDAAGWLLIGTQDQSAKWRNTLAGPILRPQMGFDLFATRDGWYYTEVSKTGFGDILNSGVRNMQETPLGLYLGTANHYFGMQLFLSSLDFHDGPGDLAPLPPQRVEAELVEGAAILTWDGKPDAAVLRVYRDTPFSPPIGVGFVDAQADYFIDPTVKPRKGYHYFMVAEDLAGQVSAPSNTTRTPTSGFSANFGLLRDWIGRYLPPQGFVAESQAAVSETRQGGGVSNQDDAPRAPVPVAGDEADQAVEISDLTITSTVSWWVYDSAWVGPNLSVEAPGQLELTAGSAITLTDGVGFGEGARGDLRIEPVDIPALQAGLRDSLFAELDRIEAQIRGGEFAIGLMSLQILRKNLLRMGEDGVLPLWQAQDLEILTDKVMRRVLLTEEGFLTLEDLFPLIPSG